MSVGVVAAGQAVCGNVANGSTDGKSMTLRPREFWQIEC